MIGPSILHVAHIEGFDNRSVLLTIVRLDDIVLSPQHGGIFSNIFKKGWKLLIAHWFPGLTGKSDTHSSLVQTKQMIQH